MRFLVAASALMASATNPVDATSIARLGQRIRVGPVSVQPLSVVQDSRCIKLVHCIQAGRLAIEAEVDGRTLILEDRKPLPIHKGYLTLMGGFSLRDPHDVVFFGPTDYSLEFRFDRRKPR
jgi:hypothetical protein